MMVGFLAHKEITNPKDLFGREQILKQLQILANNRNTVSIIGLRRFGKTSVLKCLESLLREDQSSKVYPLYFDFKEVGSIVKGTDNVYRYMVAKLTERLFIDNHFKSPSNFKKKLISPSDDWTEIYECLSDVNPVRIQCLFEEIVSFFAEYLDKTILFLFDEYEHLFRFSLDQPQGFMKLRNFSSKVIDEKVMPFCFFVSGAITWEHLCTITGSGELNCIDHSIYISSIDKTEFKRMWNEEASKIEDPIVQLIDLDDVPFQYSGGIPFYGKIIGSHLVVNKTLPEHFVLQSYFHEILNSLPAEQKFILNELTKGPKNFKNSKHILELLEKGLIVREGKGFIIKIELLKNYLLSLRSDQNDYTKKKSEAEELTDRIGALIMTINNTHKNKKGNYIFEPVNDDPALLNDLRTSCTSAPMFSDFANSLYKIVFEKTKASVHGSDVVLHRLPHPFKRGYQFIDIVDIMRHSLGGGHLMDKFTLRPNQMSKEDMLIALNNSKNEPNTAEEFLSLQIATLSLFETELNKLNQIVRASV